MGGVFDHWDVKGRRIKNRIIRSATSMRMAGKKGEVTERLIETHRNLSQGGIGIDITGHAFVSPEGRAREGQIGIYEDSLIDGLSKLCDVVHKKDTLILAQISHAGFLADPLYGDPIAPISRKGARSMDLKDISKIIEDFVKASSRAKKAGFDGIQLHAAHGYLLNQFISPLINKRNDEYGGREGGIRLLKEIMKRIREELGDEFIVAIKIGADRKGGNKKEDIVAILGELKEYGLDLAEISFGVGEYEDIVRKNIKPGENEAYNLDVALYVKKEIPELPLALVGGIRSINTANRIIEMGIDAISLCRPLIRDPYLPRKWENGEVNASDCLSCNRCAMEEGFVRCRTKQ